MDMKEIMAQKTFAVVGDTLNENKYAYIIKKELLEKGYQVYAVGKELQSLNEIEEEIDVIDLCINPIKGLKLLKECKKSYKMIVIQPGAANDELLEYLNKEQLPYVEGCILVGLRAYL